MGYVIENGNGNGHERRTASASGRPVRIRGALGASIYDLIAQRTPYVAPTTTTPTTTTSPTPTTSYTAPTTYTQDTSLTIAAPAPAPAPTPTPTPLPIEREPQGTQTPPPPPVTEPTTVTPGEPTPTYQPPPDSLPPGDPGQKIRFDDASFLPSFTEMTEGPELYNADGTPVTPKARVMSIADTIANLPTPAKIGGAVLLYLVFFSGGRR